MNRHSRIFENANLNQSDSVGKTYIIRVFANRDFREIFSVKKLKSPGAHGNRQDGFKEISANP
jgi:hypothetical protein